METQLKDEPLSMDQFMSLLQQYPVVRNSNYAPEDVYADAAPAPTPTSATPQRDVSSDQAQLLEQALKEFSLDERASTEGKDFYSELAALAQRYMTPQDTERFVQAFRAEQDAFVASLTPLEARKLREDLAKKQH